MPVDPEPSPERIVLTMAGRSAALELRDGVHFDPLNAPLYEALAAVPRGGERVLDLGCGHGALGIVAGLAGGGAVTFADVHRPSVALALSNARRNGLEHARGVCGDFVAPFAARTSARGSFDLVLCNPPQTGGSVELARREPARFGGDDGADYLVRLAQAAATLAPASDARIAFMHLSRAHPRRVQAAFRDAGFELEALRTIEREFDLDELDALAPGTGAHQLALRERGAAEFEGPLDRPRGAYRMRQTLWLASRSGR